MSPSVWAPFVPSTSGDWLGASVLSGQRSVPLTKTLFVSLLLLLLWFFG